MLVLCDTAINNTAYNLRVWFFNQLLEAKKDISKIIKGEDRGKLKFGMKVYMSLEHAWPAQE